MPHEAAIPTRVAQWIVLLVTVLHMTGCGQGTSKGDLAADGMLVSFSSFHEQLMAEQDLSAAVQNSLQLDSGSYFQHLNKILQITADAGRQDVSARFAAAFPSMGALIRAGGLQDSVPTKAEFGKFHAYMRDFSRDAASTAAPSKQMAAVIAKITVYAVHAPAPKGLALATYNSAPRKPKTVTFADGTKEQDGRNAGTTYGSGKETKSLPADPQLSRREAKKQQADCALLLKDLRKQLACQGDEFLKTLIY